MLIRPKSSVCINDGDRLHYTQTQMTESEFQKEGLDNSNKHIKAYLVSAILVAITIFLTPAGGLLNTWEEWEKDETGLLILKREKIDRQIWSERSVKRKTSSAYLRLIHGGHERVQWDDDESVWKTGQKKLDSKRFLILKIQQLVLEATQQCLTVWPWISL